MAMEAHRRNDHSQGTAAAHAPRFVSIFNPIGRRLAAAGLMGPNGLLTVRGRRSGVERTTPVAFVEVDSRRWIVGTFGDVNWARNLRAAGKATLTIKRRPEEVQAIELSPADRARFFREVLRPYVKRTPAGALVLRLLGASEILTDPDAAALHRPVFELRRSTSRVSPADEVPPAG